MEQKTLYIKLLWICVCVFLCFVLMSQIVQYKFVNTSVLDLNFVIGSLLCDLCLCRRFSLSLTLFDFSMQNAFCRTIDITVGCEVSSPSRGPLLPAHQIQSQSQKQWQRQWQRGSRFTVIVTCLPARLRNSHVYPTVTSCLQAANWWRW